MTLTSELHIQKHSSMSSSATITSLEIDCLEHILSAIPLFQLVPLQSVCTQWQSQIKLICSKQKCLYLFGCRKNIRHYIEHIIECNLADNPDFELDQTKTIIVNTESQLVTVAELFVNISKCTIYSSKQTMSTLLHQWSDKLQFLAYFHPSSQIINRLTEMKSLKSLHLFSLYDCPLPERLPPNLQKLSISCYRDDGYEELAFQNCFNCTTYSNLEQFWLHDIACDVDNLNYFRMNNPRLADKVTHLSVWHYGCYGNYLMLTSLNIFERYHFPSDHLLLELNRLLPALHTLTFHLRGHDLALKLFPRKVKLTTLHTLNLHVDCLEEYHQQRRFYQSLLIAFPNVRKVVITTKERDWDESRHQRACRVIRNYLKAFANLREFRVVAQSDVIEQICEWIDLN